MSEESRKCLPSGAAGPGSGAAAMVPTYVGAHLAAATMADPQSGQHRQRSFQAGRLLSASEWERSEWSASTLAAAERERVKHTHIGGLTVLVSSMRESASGS